MRTLSMLAVCLVLAGCSTAPATSSGETPAAAAKQDEVKKYSIHGEIQKLDDQGKTATIKHQAIGDWMGAMTMEFPVKDPADFAKLATGKTINGTVYVQGLNYWVGDVSEAPAEPAKK
ncbi:MAG: copper-binding protein [Acidobacteriota bacterium]